jgi:hypothetical protein
MQEQSRKGEPERAIEAMRELLDSAMDCNQKIVLRADILAKSLENETSKDVTKMKEDELQCSVFLQRINKILA